MEFETIIEPFKIKSVEPLRCVNECNEPPSAGFIEQSLNVEIVTNKNQRPRRSWLKVVRSVKARQRIRKSLKARMHGCSI